MVTVIEYNEITKYKNNKTGDCIKRLLKLSYFCV